MVVTFTSFPPEIVLQILGDLPQPALARTALVSGALAKLSQRILFEDVSVKGEAQFESWATTRARKHTTGLAIKLSKDELRRMANSEGWFVEVLRTGLKPKKGGRWRVMARLEIDLSEGSGDVRVPSRALVMIELVELLSFSLKGNLSHYLGGNPFPHLRHLALDSLTRTLDPTNTIVFPLVTHLSLTNLDYRHSNLAAYFPRLTDLHIANLLSYYMDGPIDDPAGPGDLVPIRAPSVTLFATDDRLERLLCWALPARLAELSLKAEQGHRFQDIHRQWENAGGGHNLRLGKLILRTHEDLQSSGGRRLVRDLDARPALVALRQAGCEVEYREETGREWRGE